MRTSLVAALLAALLIAWQSQAAALFASDVADDYNLAVGMYQQKRWDLAADNFQKFIKANPRHEKLPYARLYLGLSLVNQEKYQEARAELRGFAKDYPSSRNLADALYRVAECSYLLGDVQAAEAEFQTFVQQFPKHELMEWALPYLADAQLRLNKSQAAADNYRKALERFPQSRLTEETKFGLGRAYEAAKKYDEAAAVFRELAANDNGLRAAQSQLKLGTMAFDAGKFAEAANAYADLERRFPESPLVPSARLNSGYALYQAGDFRKASAQFDLAAKDEEQSATARYWKGLCHKALGEYAEANAVLKAVFDANPPGPLGENVLYQWADSELRLARYAAAEGLFLDVLQRWPQGEFADDSLHLAAEAALLDGRLDDAQKLAARFPNEFPRSPLRLRHELLEGRLLDAKGGEANLKGAVGHFQKVLAESELPSTQSLARFHLARAWQKLGDHAKAVETVTPLIEFVRRDGAKSEFVDALVLQGVGLHATNKFDEAAKAMSHYLELRPDGPLADQALATRALAEMQLKNKAAAQADLAALAMKYPQSPLVAPTTHQLAEGAFAAKDWEWAAGLFDALVKAGPDSPYHAKGLSGLGWSQYEQKKFAEAAAAFAQIVKVHPTDRDLAPEAAYMQGKSLQDSNQLPEAAAAYAAAFKTFAPEGQSPAGAEQQKGPAYYAYRAGLQAARVLVTTKKIEEADAAYADLLARFPKPENLDRLLDEWALVNYEAGRYARSDEIFRRLVNETPDSDLADNARLSLAESVLIAGKLEEAKKSLAELQSSPKSDEQVQQVALNHLIGIGVEAEHWKDVQATSEELLKRFPESKYRRHAEFQLGQAQLHLGQTEEALATLAKLKAEQANAEVSRAEWFPRVWVLLAEGYFRLKKYDEVVRTADEFRAWDPKSAFLYQADEVLGRSWKNQAQFDKARAAFQRAVADPAGRRTETAAKCQFLLAETYLLQKDYKKALEEYLKVYVLYEYPEWQAPALYQSALCDEALEQWKKAADAYEDLLKKFPESEFAEKAKARLETARRKAG